MSKRHLHRRWYRLWLPLVLLVFVHCHVAALATAGEPDAGVAAADPAGDCHDPGGSPDPAETDPCPQSESVASGTLAVAHPPFAGAAYLAAATSRRQLRLPDPGRILRRPPCLAELCRLLI